MIAWIWSVVSATPTVIQVLALIYLIIPVVGKLFPSVFRQAAFLNYICPPLSYLQLHRPNEVWKMAQVENHYIPGKAGKLGLWHVSPSTECLEDASKVIIYCHGNAFHRGMGHRIKLYYVMKRSGFHVITFDYRGFGDSDGVPSEIGLVEDAVTVYKWTVQQIKNSNCHVLLWGHSLGTTISTQAFLKLQNEHYLKQPDGLVLEAAFTSLTDALTKYPLSKIVLKMYPKWLIYDLILEGIKKNNLSFNTANCLPQLCTNVLMLHAKDDNRIPFELGEKLFKTVKQSSQCKSCHFVSFESKLHLGHNDCWSFCGLSGIIEQFTLDTKSGVPQRFKDTHY